MASLLTKLARQSIVCSQQNCVAAIFTATKLIQQYSQQVFFYSNQALQVADSAEFEQATQTQTQFQQQTIRRGQLLNNVSVYTVEVITGDLRGAGTELPAYLRMFGENGESTQFELGKPENEDGDGAGFPRDSVRRYVLHVDGELGQLRRIHVGLPKNVIFDSNKAGWYLENVIINGPRGEKWKFPCQSWFGMDEAGENSGALERNLFPCAQYDGQQQAKRVRVQCGGIAIPHPKKQKEGMRGFAGKHEGYAGEDAYFFTEGRNGIVGMGVADGVYAWKNQGIDSGMFSRKLMEYSRGLVRGGFEDVLKIMQISNRQLQSEGVFGSSTCCLLTIDTNTGRLHIANLGDSGVLVFNLDDQQIKYRTSQQEHEFGFPFQLGHHSNADKPENARLATLRVGSEDVVVMGSDGLFDNLAGMDIIREIRNSVINNKTPLQIARHLCGLAYQNSVDSSKVTPYSLAASEWFNMVFNGGKKDDITVLVGLVSSNQ